MKPAGAPVRIWYQSFVDPEAQAPYMERLRYRLREVSAPGVTVDVHGISPADRHFHAITEFRCAEQTIHAALRAEREGYDAFVIGHFQEPGLVECRGAVDIPVVALGEASLLQACALGRRIGLVTIDPAFIPWHEAQVAHHGLQQRVAGIAAITADLARFMKAFTDRAEYEALRRDFAAQVQDLIARGADVLIPARRPADAALLGRPALPHRQGAGAGGNRHGAEDGGDGGGAPSPHGYSRQPRRSLRQGFRRRHRGFSRADIPDLRMGHLSPRVYRPSSAPA